MKEKSKKKEKVFLKKPEYPGGEKALQQFITSHLKYPEDALKEGVQGVVTVAYEVNDNGEIESARIIKGLHPSCDEEALRLVRMLQYGKAYNHGVRVKSNHKANIHFRLPQQKAVRLQVSYDSTTQQDIETTKPKEKEEYTYSIRL
ncbi:MAG: energy transducer TonB [Bacteroidales bacterium]|nr:energy transducer TonB [Bacteroidales bacterium]